MENVVAMTLWLCGCGCVLNSCFTTTPLLPVMASPNLWYANICFYELVFVFSFFSFHEFSLLISFRALISAMAASESNTPRIPFELYGFSRISLYSKLVICRIFCGHILFICSFLFVADAAAAAAEGFSYNFLWFIFVYSFNCRLSVSCSLWPALGC